MNATWQTEMSARLDHIYLLAAAGDDIPPGLQLRAEGFAEAGLLLGLIDRAGLAQLIDTHHRAHLGESVLSNFGYLPDEAISDAGQVCLPVQMRRAPVVPSTAD